MNSRQLALDILMDIEEKKEYSNISINRHLSRHKDLKDGNFVRELVYGVLENEIYIDYIIRKKSNRRLKKIQPRVLMILRMGVYQICFLDRVPDSAAVNESVKLSKVNGQGRTSGFVNGILRNIVREKDELMKIEAKEAGEYLSIKYSHPLWLVEKWIEEYGYKFTEDLCRANNESPSLNIRANTSKISRDELKEKLEKEGFIVEKTKYSSYGLLVDNPRNIVGLDLYKKGFFTIQDESSMLVGELIDPEKESLILDMCAAPGGKAGHLGELLNNTGRVIARDIYPHKLELIKATRDRLGLKNLDIELHDALELDSSLIAKLDYCILDAPCSALGTIRRSPEIKKRRSQEDIEEIRRLQKKLLNIASNYVKPGGHLIYSTCTINRDENIYMVRDFLKENKDFRLASIEGDNFRDFKNAKEGYLEIYPNLHVMDGFFIAKLERINNKSLNMI